LGFPRRLPQRRNIARESEGGQQEAGKSMKEQGKRNQVGKTQKKNDGPIHGSEELGKTKQIVEAKGEPGVKRRGREIRRLKKERLKHKDIGKTRAREREKVCACTTREEKGRGKEGP